jgi:hypothetical protein
MRLSAFLACSSLAILVTVTPASAEEPSFGVTIGYPGSVGVVWQPSARIAVRPSFTFRNSGSDPMNDVGDFESSSLSSTVSALFYVRPAGPLRVYVTPRYSFGRTSATTTIQVPQIQLPFGTITTTSITTTRSTLEHGVAGLIGVEYRLAERFGVFGEVGLLYTRASLSSDTDNWAVGSTSGIGVTLYF